MKFEINNLKKSINDIMRLIGYTPAYFQNEGEFSIVRRLGLNDYPRFHLYIKETKETGKTKATNVNGSSYIFSIHLDQKKPSYGNSSHAHSGEYGGELIDNEAERIKNILM